MEKPVMKLALSLTHLFHNASQWIPANIYTVPRYDDTCCYGYHSRIVVDSWRRNYPQRTLENKIRLPSNLVNILRTRQNGWYFADVFNCISLNKNSFILIYISFKFVLKHQFNNKSSLVQVMFCHWTGDKPLPELIISKTYQVIWPN